MIALLITSFVILLSYTAYYLSRVGLLPSHSDSYLALGKQGWIFQVVMVFLGMAVRATAKRNPTGIPEIDNTNWDIYRGFGCIQVQDAINYINNM